MGTNNLYPKWKAIVDSSGDLKVIDHDGFQLYLSRFIDHEDMQIVVRPRVKQRSRQEEKYYHAVVVQMVATEMCMDPQYAHDLMRKLFLRVEESYMVGGKKIRYERIKSTTELTDREYDDYVFKNCVPWASLPTGDNGLDAQSGLGLYIPLPNEVDYSQYGY